MTENGRWTCKCGRELDELDNYCGGCGAKRPADAPKMSDDEILALELEDAHEGCWSGDCGTTPRRSEKMASFLVRARELLGPAAEAKGRREAYSRMLDEMDSLEDAYGGWSLMRERLATSRDACGPAKAAAEGFPTDHMPVIPEHAKMTAFHGQGEPAHTAPVTTALRGLGLGVLIYERGGCTSDDAMRLANRAHEASALDQAAAVKAATEPLQRRIAELEAEKREHYSNAWRVKARMVEAVGLMGVDAHDWHEIEWVAIACRRELKNLKAERDDLRAKLAESEQRVAELNAKLATSATGSDWDSIRAALPQSDEWRGTHWCVVNATRILIEQKAEIESLRGDYNRIARIRNEDAQWFARLSNFLSSDAMKNHHRGFRGHCVEDAIEVMQRMTSERDEAVRASYEHGQTVARLAMAADGLRANLDSLPRYRPVADELGRLSMTKQTGQWDAENPGWLNVDAVYALLAPAASPEREKKDDGAGDIIAYVTEPVMKRGPAPIDPGGFRHGDLHVEKDGAA